MFQNAKGLSWFASNKLNKNETPMQTEIKTSERRRLKVTRWGLAAWFGGLAVLAGSAGAMADGTPQKVKPTLVVITPGFQPNGRAMPHDWVDPLADKVEGQLTQYGSKTHTLVIGWNSLLPNAKPADHVAGRVRDFLGQQNEEWDVLFIGHSRGAILNNKAIAELGNPRNLGYLEEIMLDPTAAHFAGDQYPKEVPTRVNHAINYDDNHRLAGDVSKGGKPIENAENRNIGLGHNSDAGAHTSIHSFWTENRAEQDIGEFLSKKENRQKESLVASSNPSPKSRERVNAPVASKDRWLDESGRAIGDVISTGRKAADDSARQGNRVVNDLSREAGGLGGHFNNAIANPGRAAVAGRDRILAGALHARDMAASGKKSAGKVISTGSKNAGSAISSGAKSAGGVISTGAKTAGGIVSTGAKNAGGAISSGAKSAGGYLSTGAKSAGGVVSSGAKNAGRSISLGAKSAGGVISTGAKSTGRVVSTSAKNAGRSISSGAKSTGGVVSNGAKSVGGVVSSSAKNTGGAISRKFKSVFGR